MERLLNGIDRIMEVPFSIKLYWMFVGGSVGLVIGALTK